mmetsp:Transcript_56208/g.100087  ORF Transcript_56208/g.100087 Transcript_56208/m.100087 type:complete len:170 (+) Transcript_56208:5660-6169(+)
MERLLSSALSLPLYGPFFFYVHSLPAPPPRQQKKGQSTQTGTCQQSFTNGCSLLIGCCQGGDQVMACTRAQMPIAQHQASGTSSLSFFMTAMMKWTVDHSMWQTSSPVATPFLRPPGNHLTSAYVRVDVQPVPTPTHLCNLMHAFCPHTPPLCSQLEGKGCEKHPRVGS